MDEIGRAPSIIDGRIQNLQKKLKDAPADDKEFITKSINALETLWDDVSSRYIRRKVSGSSLGKPIASKNFPYHREWTTTGKITESMCDIYDMSSLDECTRWTLLLAEEKGVRYLFKSFDEYDAVSRVRPFDKISYPVKAKDKEGKKLAGFTYPYCQTMSKYVENLSSGLNHELPRVVKGLIISLIALEEKFEKGGKLDQYHFDRRICIVEEKIGSLIFLTSPAKQGSIQTRNWKTEYVSLADYIRKIFPDSKSLPYGLAIVLNCMDLAHSKQRRLRLLKAPYFLTDEEKVMKFIPMMSYVRWICPDIPNPKLNWQGKVLNKYGQAVDDVLKKKEVDYGMNRRSFSRFLFNCVKHLVVEDGSVDGKSRLIKQMMDKIDATLLDDFFENTYTCCNWKTIPMIDVL